MKGTTASQQRGRRVRNGRVTVRRPASVEAWQRALERANNDATRLRVGPKGGVTVAPARDSRRKRSSLSGKIATHWIDSHNRR